MPRSRSWSLESMTRSEWSPCSPNAPDCSSMALTRVGLPWSAWASMATLRNSVVVTKGITSQKIKKLASKQYSQLLVDALFTLPHVTHILSDRCKFLQPHPFPLLSCADSHSPSSPSLPPFLFHCSPPFYYPAPSLNPAHVPFALTRFTGLPRQPISVSAKRTSTAAPALSFSRFL